MSQQQFLLIVLSLIIIGAAIAVAAFLFIDHSVSANRDGVSSDLLRFSVRAYQYYVRPKTWGGGEKSFEGIDMDYITQHPQNANGTYSIASATPTEVVLRGVGVERGADGNHITATMTIRPDTIFLILQN